jgi:N-carbamoyl-L-amino-acid hydrolase
MNPAPDAQPGRRPSVDAADLLDRIRTFGDVGRAPDGRLSRVAGSEADRAGRDTLVTWMKECGLLVEIDAIGNVFGSWGREQHDADTPVVMMGSHVDTVADAGIYDGAYGVLAGLAVIKALIASGVRPARPVTLAAFTNEEGVAYTPDMMGSLVHAGGLALADALASPGPDGTTLGAALERIGYAGSLPPGSLRPDSYLELHIEQGPILAAEGVPIGVVEHLQGISWQRFTIEGEANHAGTTPMHLRRDAGYAAARIVTLVHDLASASNGSTVGTVGSLAVAPGVVNVIPGRAVLTVDLRDRDGQRLSGAEASLAQFVEGLARETGVRIDVERLVRLDPVAFDPGLCTLVEAAARRRGIPSRRMTSGAGHDAQMIARIAPAAMIFVPSTAGISHSPREHTPDDALVAGANVLLDVVAELAGIERR